MSGFLLGTRVRVTAAYRRELCRRYQEDRYLDTWDELAIRSRLGTVVMSTTDENQSVRVRWDEQESESTFWVYPSRGLRAVDA